MRLEATVPDVRGRAVAELADELGLSRSQVVDEALALFLKAIVEVRRGRKLVTLEPGSSQPACEIATPTLSMFEWARNPKRISLTPEAFERLKSVSEAPTRPSARLKAAAKRHTR